MRLKPDDASLPMEKQMLIERNLIITKPAHNDTLDVHPHGTSCEQDMQHHVFVLDYQCAGFIYRICARCGTVRIGEQLPGSAGK